MPLIGSVKPDLKIRSRKPLHDRRPVSESLGCHVKGIAPTHPDHDSPFDYAAGIFQRFGRMTPYRSQKVYQELMKFTDEMLDHWELKYGLTRLEPEDMDVHKWIDSINHCQSRKDQLHKAADEDFDPLKDIDVSMFIKDEFYEDQYKYPRLICSRNDKTKCRLGPMFSRIEKAFFKLPMMIKKIAVDERAAYIFNYLYKPGYYYFSTDYSAYETHFVKLMMVAVEFRLYQRLAPKDEHGTQFLKDLNFLLGTNHCKNKLIDAWIKATRMSGENCTSLGNGFSNVIFTKFACRKAGCKAKLVAEGDDGVTRVNKKIDPKIFRELGLIVKYNEEKEISEASFCGLISDELAKQDVSNPLKILAKFGWSNRKYVGCSLDTKYSLAVAKALSYLYQYPHLPVVRPFMNYILRVTPYKNYKVLKYINSLDQYTRELYLKAFDRRHSAPDYKPEIATRTLVEKLYGISVKQQLEAETYLDSLQSYGEVDLKLDFGEGYQLNYDRYVSDFTSFNEVWADSLSTVRVEQLIFERET